MSDYQEYERACEIIREENEVLLKAFHAWLEAQKLGEETIRRHFSNAAFYIQEFLLYEQPLRPQQGGSGIDMYLGSWFIRKGPIATPGTVKTSATSLIKFYSFLVEKGLVTAQQLEKMRRTIKTEMKRWQGRARLYNDPNITDWRGMGLAIN
jgi:hypothetical protein